MSSFCRTIDVLANCVIIGVPVWVFFLQSPLLFQFMGRDRFLSPMMQITKLMFRWTLPICAAVSVLCSLGLEGHADTASYLTSALSLVSVMINATIIVPKALMAGKRATRTAYNTQNVSAFAVDGGHKSETRTLHQTVLVFVVISLLASVAHVHLVVNGER